MTQTMVSMSAGGRQLPAGMVRAVRELVEGGAQSVFPMRFPAAGRRRARGRGGAHSRGRVCGWGGAHGQECLPSRGHQVECGCGRRLGDRQGVVEFAPGNLGEPGWRAPVVVVDGRSGSGKTTCASLCAQAMRSAGVSGVQLVHVDALYPGWSGLSAATEMLSALLTGSAMRRVGYWAWDWQRSRPGHWVQLDPFKPLIIEGAGSLCPATAAASDLRIWVDVQSSSARPHPFQSDLRIWVDVEANGNGTQVRRSRALKRDGDTYRPKWQMWAEQEDEHIVRHRPRSLADIVIANPPA